MPLILEKNMTLDANGRQLKIGEKVLLLRIDEIAFEYLPKDECDSLRSMIGELVTICDIRGEYICVEKEWHKGEGLTEIHRITVSPMDVVSPS